MRAGSFHQIGLRFEMGRLVFPSAPDSSVGGARVSQDASDRNNDVSAAFDP